MKVKAIAATIAALVCAATMLRAAPAAAARQNEKPSIVLVHGAFADGSSWSKVIGLLRAKGYTVVAVQNPLSSLADDVAKTEHAINLQPGPVVLVGHSWAGVVITQAGNNPKVKALVYVDAFAPDSGQSIADVTAGLPDAPWASTVIKDEAGFLSLPATTVAHDFAQDLPPADQEVVAATQGPWFSGALADKVTKAAWHDKPTWWVLGTNDHMIDPSLQEKTATTIKAQLTKIPTSHVAMLADPKAVTGVILAAAASLQSGSAANAPTQCSTTHHIADDVELSDPSGAQVPDVSSQTVREVLGPAPVVPIADQGPTKLFVDPPLPDALASGGVVIQFRAENLHIVPVLGPAAVNISPRIGHVHVSVDDSPWVWANLTGQEVMVYGLPAGQHKVTIELVNANHASLAKRVVEFEVPARPAAKPSDPAAAESASNQPAAKIVVDAPQSEPLARGVAFIRYHAENLQIAPVFGPAAAAVTPRVGHIHVTVDDAPWHWTDASGGPVVINGLPAGPHSVLIVLADPNHRPLARSVVRFVVPSQSAAQSSSTATAQNAR